jgi:hypothetical protein
MVRVITTGGTARVLLDGKVSDGDDMDEVVAGIRQCADEGVQELLINVPEFEPGWLEILEEALIDSPDLLRIWVAVGDSNPGASLTGPVATW